MKNYRLFKVLFYWSKSKHSKIYQNIVICSLYNLNIIFFLEKAKDETFEADFVCLATCLSLNVYSKERFVIRQFAYFKPIWCTYLKYTHFTYWSLKLKRNVCITCRAISLTSKPETNLANPRLLIFFCFFCWYIPLRVVCLLNNSKNSRNFFYLKWIHVFFCSLLVIMNFSHHFQMAYQKGFFLPTYMPLSNFSNSRSKRFVFIHIIFFYSVMPKVSHNWVSFQMVDQKKNWFLSVKI